MRGADALPARVLVDPLRLRPILDNLCGTARKFTHAGGIEVEVRCTTHGSTTDLDLSVRDTGIGVAADRQPELFAPFVQADASTTRRYGGTGLGLAICDELARAMGGALRLE
ncbi:MAG: ATP-binding protein, partial [bacterium]